DRHVRPLRLRRRGWRAQDHPNAYAGRLRERLREPGQLQGRRGAGAQAQNPRARRAATRKGNAMSLWVAGGALVGAIGGSIISGNASKKAAQTSADASAEASKVIRDNYLDTKAALKPYGDTGIPALNR